MHSLFQTDNTTTTIDSTIRHCTLPRSRYILLGCFVNVHVFYDLYKALNSPHSSKSGPDRARDFNIHRANSVNS